MNEEGFVSFECEHCHTSIEASSDMVGEATECPACGQKIVIPANNGDEVVRHGPDEVDSKSQQAEKSRTIRIELGDL